MSKLLILLMVITAIYVEKFYCDNSLEEDTVVKKDPSILIVTLIRNKAHTLPYFFSYLENQDYAKDRISLWLTSDHNEDDSIKVTEAWINATSHLYHNIQFHQEGAPKRRKSENNLFHWTDERMLDVVRMKEEGFAYGRKILADYILFLDADVFLTNPTTLKTLISFNLPVVAPLMKTESLYSNFWGGMRENYFYKRTDEYIRIQKHEKVGEIKVPLVSAVILIDLNNPKSKYLTYDKVKLITHDINGSGRYNGPFDDMILLAKSADYAGLGMHISNSKSYGYMMAPVDHESLIQADEAQLRNVLVMIVNELGELFVAESMKDYLPKVKKHKISLSKIFIINLERRKEKFLKLKKFADIIGLEVERFVGVDGDTLTTDYLYDEGVRLIPEYENMFDKRPMRLGEVGCFMSHYKVWENIVDLGLDEVLVLEDDIIFEHYFVQMTQAALTEARSLVKDFELIYIGRNALGKDGPSIKGSKLLREPGPSLTLSGYIITFEGARKLINTKPLQKMVPVDEFVGIMYDKHSNEFYKKYFPKRHLKVYAMDPPIVSVQIKGNVGWISDTENSKDIEDIEKLYVEEVKPKDEL